MIELYNRKDELSFLDYLARVPSQEFYLTENNIRTPVKNKFGLRKLLKNSSQIFVKKEKGDIQGVIMKWKSNSDDVKRDYVKVSAINPQVVSDLLTIILWNSNCELYVKIDNNSPFKSKFEEKGFRFYKGRGLQILMRRQHYVNNFNKFRGKD